MSLPQIALAGILISSLLPPAVGADEDRVWQTSVKLQQPKKSKGRTEGALDEVPLHIWLPADVKVVRGAVFNPFYLKAVEQMHWQEFCRQHDFALLAGNYFAVRADEFNPTLLKALTQFAKQSAHPEIEHLPLCLVGMSAGAGMSVRFTEQLPQRVIAAGPVCLEVGPRDEASGAVPMVTVFGERDGRQLEKLLEKLPQARSQSAQWAIAVQWRRRHEFGRANNILMPLFSRAIAYRYPKDATPIDGPVPLRDYEQTAGWLGDANTWGEATPFIAQWDNFDREKTRACWLPDAYLAHTWAAFVTQKPLVKLTSPAGQGDGQPFEVFPADKPLAIKAAVPKSTEIEKLEIFDGDQSLGELAGPAWQRESKLAAGVHALFLIATLKDGRRVFSNPNTILVSP